MASTAAGESASLLNVAFHLPASPSAGPALRASSPVVLLIIAALLTTIYALPDAGSVSPASADALRSEINEIRLKVARLESVLEENTHTMKFKANTLEEDIKLIEAMEHDIQIFMNGQESTKKSQRKLYPESKIKTMEEEVQILQQEDRKIINIADKMEYLALDAQRRVESLISELQKIEDIIAEQWIQIRQFEQAFVLTKIMTSKVHERSRSSENSYKWPEKHIFLEYIRNIDLHDIFLVGASYTRSCFSHTYKHYNSLLQGMDQCCHKVSQFRRAVVLRSTHDIYMPNALFLGGSISKSCVSLPYNHFKIFLSSAQKVHCKVLLLHAMESNRYSRGLANELIAFCLAYLVVISPMWIAWFLYSMRSGSKK